MKIRYRNTFADRLFLTGYTFVRTPLIIALFLIYVLLSSFVNMSSAMEAVSTSDMAVRFLFLEGRSIAVMAGVLIVLAPLSLLSRKNRNYRLDQELTISEYGVVQQSEVNRSELKWEGIVKVARTRRYLFLYVNPFSAHVIPRRAFADAVQWEAFYTAAVLYFNMKAHLPDP